MTNSPAGAEPVPNDLPDEIESGAAAVSPRTAVSAAQGLAGAARNRLIDVVEDGKSELARSFEGLVTMAQELAARIDSDGDGIVSGYARKAADLLGELHVELRDRPVEELLEEGRDLIRRSPAVAVGIAAVAGFVAIRLLKANNR